LHRRLGRKWKELFLLTEVVNAFVADTMEIIPSYIYHQEFPKFMVNGEEPLKSPGGDWFMRQQRIKGFKAQNSWTSRYSHSRTGVGCHRSTF
jgi:hypothetical protein